MISLIKNKQYYNRLTYTNLSNLLFNSFSQISNFKINEIRNPLTNEIVYSKEESTLKQILNDTQESKQSQQIWSEFSIDQRKIICNNFVDIIQKNNEQISTRISAYTGKPLKESQLEIKASIHRMKSLINISEDALKPEIIENQIKKGKRFEKFITKHPIGTALIISPWNYPMLTASSVLITALLAGNNVLLKPSPQTIGIADDFVNCFIESASQNKQNNIQNLIKNVYTSELDSLPYLYKSSDYLSFTGSINTGLKVQKESINANPYINCVLEMGGKDSAYIHKSCENYLDDVVKQILISKFTNSGQSCCAIQRVYCDSSLLQQFISKLQNAIQNVKINQIDENNANENKNQASFIEIGPLTLKNHAQFIQKQVDSSLKNGAQILNKNGGTIIESPLTQYNKNDEISRKRGYFPTILLNVSNDMEIMQEETFGPVLPIFEIKNDYKEALQLMNDSKYGLTASIFCSNEDIIKEMSNKLNVGTVLVNQSLMMDPLLPWIGWNQSGKNFSLSKHGFDQVTKMKSHNHIYYL